MTSWELTQQFNVTRRALYQWVQDGILPHPQGRGPAARWDPSCSRLIREYLLVREQFNASKADLRERRQLTGQLLPPAIAHGPV